MLHCHGELNHSTPSIPFTSDPSQPKPTCLAMTASRISSPSLTDKSSSSSGADAPYYGPVHTLELEEFDKPKEYLYSHTYYNVPLGLHLKRGRYAIVRKLGWGSFGTVWLARDRK